MGSTIPVRASPAPVRLLTVPMRKSVYLKMPSSRRLAVTASPAARRRWGSPDWSHRPKR